MPVPGNKNRLDHKNAGTLAESSGIFCFNRSAENAAQKRKVMKKSSFMCGKDQLFMLFYREYFFYQGGKYYGTRYIGTKNH